ncbi:MAG: hypothetical protein ACREB3_16060 [Burkholderiales bacterium]
MVFRETRNEKPETREGLADYRADRDDFGRLLYLVFQEIQAQKEAREKGVA